MKTLLIVDDEEINRVTLENGFSDSYKVIQAGDGYEAVGILKKCSHVDAILLDLNMPVVDGLKVLQILSEHNVTSKIPVFIVTAEASDETLDKVFALGVVDVIIKPYKMKILQKRVESQIAFFEQKKELEAKVAAQSEDYKRYGFRFIETMADMVEYRSKDNGLHVKRVRGFTKILMDALVEEYPEYDYLKNDIENITFAACLHDIGKYAIPDYVLTKTTPFTRDEIAVMQTHTVRGYEQIVMMQDFMTPELYKYCLDVVRHHHERYDGQGYPDKLKGEEISIWSQAVGLADAYDALTNDRCYQKAYDHDTAVQMIMNGECGGQFNPKLLNVFRKNTLLFDSYRIALQKRLPNSKKRILVIDDSEIDREVIAGILKKEYEVIVVENARIGLELLNDSRQCFDAILVDVNMPIIDGFKTVEFLGRRFVKNVPVILMSSETNNTHYQVRGATLGTSGFIGKPFDTDLILDRFHELFEILKN